MFTRDANNSHHPLFWTELPEFSHLQSYPPPDNQRYLVRIREALSEGKSRGSAGRRRQTQGSQREAGERADYEDVCDVLVVIVGGSEGEA